MAEIDSHLPAILREGVDWADDMRSLVRSCMLPKMTKPMLFRQANKHLQMDMRFEELRGYCRNLSNGFGNPTTIGTMLHAKDLREEASPVLTDALALFRGKMFDIASRQYMRRNQYRHRFDFLAHEAATCVPLYGLDLRNSAHRQLLNHAYFLQELTRRYGEKMDDVIRRSG